MAWRTYTEADLKTVFSGAELESIRAAALADGQADPIAAAITAVTDHVRGYIAAHPVNTLGESGTLPERLIRTAGALLPMDVMRRVAGLSIDINDVRKLAYAEAQTTLRDVSRGDFAVETPDEAGTDDESAPSPSIAKPVRTLSRTQQDGI